VQKESGAKVLAALKAFSMWSLGPLVGKYLSGTCASGVHEARLGREHYGGEVHTYSAAYTEKDMREVLELSDHVVFNSPAQWKRFRAIAERSGKKFGLRVNPEHSEGNVALYDPCAPFSRLGTPRNAIRPGDLDGLSGLHFHTLCEQDFPPLERTLKAFEEKFGDLMKGMEWANFGGGHHVTRPGYQVEDLIRTLRGFAERYKVQVYIEPGEAVAYHSGVLVAEVLDVMHNGMPIAILDTSATCHMPDTLEMPYRAGITGAGEPGKLAHTYRLGGQSCLAGDVIGDYSFAQPLQIGQRLVFEDMAYYTMVKTTTFNGVRLASIAIWNSRTDALRVVRDFGYEDFKGRLS
jgi:carboxynorspermidine decarboxylase